MFTRTQIPALAQGAKEKGNNIKQHMKINALLINKCRETVRAIYDTFVN